MNKSNENIKSLNKNLKWQAILYSYIIVIVFAYFMLILMIPQMKTDNLMNDKFKLLLLYFMFIYVILKFAELLPKILHISIRRIISIFVFSMLLKLTIMYSPIDSGLVASSRLISNSVSLFLLFLNILICIFVGNFADAINNRRILANKVMTIIIFIILCLILLHN